MLPKPLTTLHHIALKVRNLDNVSSFYGTILGLPLLREWHTEAQALRAVWLDLGGSILMLERSDTAQTTATPPLPNFNDDPIGWHLLAFAIEVDDRAEWETYFNHHHVPIVHDTLYSFYIQDPEGNRIGFSHYPVPWA